MQRLQINPPTQDDIKTEHRDLYKKRHMKSVAAFAGVHPSTLSRKLNEDEEKTVDHVYETVMEMYGAVQSGQPEIGKGIIRMVNRFANDFGLLDEEPINILQLAIDNLTQTQPDEIRAMDKNSRRLLEMYSAELKEVAGQVHRDALFVRREEEGTPRGYEIPRAVNR